MRRRDWERGRLGDWGIWKIDDTFTDVLKADNSLIRSSYEK